MSSWGRGKTQESSDVDLEAQNDQHLNDLHSKISQLRSVSVLTTSTRFQSAKRARRADSRRRRHRLATLAGHDRHLPGFAGAELVVGQYSEPKSVPVKPGRRVDPTLSSSQSNTFDSFKTSLSNTSTRFARSVQSGKGPGRIQLGIVVAFVLLFFLYKFSSTRGGSP
ncbi:hypothetical protein BJY59DRAFT_586132 [Rhodotorula toruloides]